jgi:hypothetical protein
VVTAVEGTPVDRGTNFDALLQYRIGKRTALTVVPAAGGASREVVVRPVNLQTEKGLLYREWVEGRRAEVVVVLQATTPFRGAEAIDRAVQHVLKHSGSPFTVKPFIPYGYDERQLCSPELCRGLECSRRWHRRP